MLCLKKTIDDDEDDDHIPRTLDVADDTEKD